MGSLGAMEQGSKDRYFQDASATPTSSCRKASRAACRTAARCATSSTSSSAACARHGLRRLRARSRRCAREPKFVRVTGAGMRESHVHDVQITKEAPNYRVSEPSHEAVTASVPSSTLRLQPHDRHPWRQDPDPRFRRAVHAADRAPHPRVRRLLRDLGLGPRPGASIAAFGAEGHHPFGRSGVRHRRRHAARAAGSLRRSACRCSASATACRPWPRSSGGSARRRPIIASSVTREVDVLAAMSALLDGFEYYRTTMAAAARRVDEPRRSRHLYSCDQYTQLIARRIREFGVYCEIWAWDHDPAEIAAVRRRRASSCPAARSRRPKPARRARRRRCSTPACRSSASATACRRWRCSSAARSKAATTASSAMPKSKWSRGCACSTA